MPEESKLQTKILKDLESRGKHCVCFKIMKANVDGVPDVFFSTVETGGVFIEAKRRKGGVVSPSQKLMIEKLNRCGSITFLCKSWVMWMEIKKEVGLK